MDRGLWHCTGGSVKTIPEKNKYKKAKWLSGRPGLLRFMGSQRVGHNWVTELNWIKLNFLEEISRLSHSIVFLYFFALITEEVFLISPCYSLELFIQMSISFLFSFAFHFWQPFCLFVFIFLWDCLDTASCTMSQTSVHSPSRTLSIRSNPLNLYATSTV